MTQPPASTANAAAFGAHVVGKLVDKHLYGLLQNSCNRSQNVTESSIGAVVQSTFFGTARQSLGRLTPFFDSLDGGIDAGVGRHMLGGRTCTLRSSAIDGTLSEKYHVMEN